MKSRYAILTAFVLTFVTTAVAAEENPKGKSYSVPFKLESDHIVVDGKVGWRPMRFMVDTGMEADIVLTEVARQVGINVQSPKATLEVGGLTIKDMEWMLYDLPALQGVYRDTKVGMILGAPFLNRHIVTFDFKKSQFTFQEPGEKEPAWPKNAIVVPYTDFRGCVQLELKINGMGPYKALLDTGSPYLRLTSSVMQQANPGSDIARTIEVGAAKAQNMKVSSNATLDGMLKRAGLDALIGLRFLSQYTATIDYKRKRMILVK